MPGRLKLAIMITLAGFLSVSCAGRLACKDKLDGTKCETLSEVYEDQVINRGQAPEPKDLKEQQSRKEKQESQKKESDNGSGIVKALKIEELQPLRLPPKIVGIWLAPWEDEDGDLHASEYIYLEVSQKEGKWVIGEKAVETKNPVLKRIEDIPTTASDPGNKKTISEAVSGDMEAIKAKTRDGGPDLKKMLQGQGTGQGIKR